MFIALVGMACADALGSLGTLEPLRLRGGVLRPTYCISVVLHASLRYVAMRICARARVCVRMMCGSLYIYIHISLCIEIYVSIYIYIYRYIDV